MYCSVLGAHAVHVAMAGYTGIVVGKVDERCWDAVRGVLRMETQEASGLVVKDGYSLWLNNGHNGSMMLIADG